MLNEPTKNNTAVPTKFPRNNPLAAIVTTLISQIAIPPRIPNIKGVMKSRRRLDNPMMHSTSHIIAKRNSPMVCALIILSKK